MNVPGPIISVKAACPHDCPDTCAMEVHVQDGIAIEVVGAKEYGPTAGTLCTKVSRYAERTYHPERVLEPLRRVGAKGRGEFEPISWDAALTTITARLEKIARDDAQKILPYSYAGTMGRVQGESMSQRFFHRLGASLLDRTICSTAGAAGHIYTAGARLGMDMEQEQHARFILFWGANAITSSLHFWGRAQQAKRAKICSPSFLNTFSPIRLTMPISFGRQRRNSNIWMSSSPMVTIT